MFAAMLIARTLLLDLASRLSFLAPTLARVCLGVIFANSGWAKLHNLEAVTAYFADLGIPMAEIQAPFAAGTELVCGLLLLAGLFTRLAAVPLIVVMTVALLTAKLSDIGGFIDMFGEVEFTYILLLAYLGLNGPGPLSLDRLLAGRLERAPEPVPTHLPAARPA